MIRVVYHLVGKTDWSKVAVNGTHQNPEWKLPWDVRVPFPRTSPPGRMQTERSGTSGKSKWNAHFPFGYSGWEFWTTSGARSIKPKFPEIPVQNQMERNISKTLFRKFRSTSRRARPIKPKFPEIPVQNQMERNISKTLFRKLRSTSQGCPFFRKLGITGNFLFHLPFHYQIDLPDSPRRFLVNYPPQKGQYLLFGCNEWSPMWISHRYATSLDNSLAGKFARFPCHPKTISLNS